VIIFTEGSPRDRIAMKDSNRQTRESAYRLAEPELTLVHRGEGADPRLLELVRLLARRAARQAYEEQMKGRRTTRS
jgi:hypothetical protein